MENKEERIIIVIAEPSLLKDVQIRYTPCMTRTEAIEKMAKALCLAAVKSAELCKKNCDKPCIMWKSYEIYAEPALNALLGDK